MARGAYVLADTPEGKPEVILIATGSEVCLAVEAHEELLAEGIRSRVVSMPSWEIFDHQTKEYPERVLPPDVMARVAIEQASTFGWERYVGCSGHIIGMKTFGASAPLKELQQKFGFEPERLVAAAKEQLGRKWAGIYEFNNHVRSELSPGSNAKCRCGEFLGLLQNRHRHGIAAV